MVLGSRWTILRLTCFQNVQAHATVFETIKIRKPTHFAPVWVCVSPFFPAGIEDQHGSQHGSSVHAISPMPVHPSDLGPQLKQASMDQQRDGLQTLITTTSGNAHKMRRRICEPSTTVA